ncbi:MAG: hypothetical protein H6813_03185 [Phycisphaeraceae bacterium]|nr:hypothetical protein [Phycisphaeraceae bacterium]MCB9846949.1 hypothetical protein [Phycisphaeraceae bacterium]
MTHRRTSVLLPSLALAAASFSALAQHDHAAPVGAEPLVPQELTPNLAEPVLRAIEAPYLSDDERADIRVFHGVWLESDLADPNRRARAALDAGVWDDPALRDQSVDPVLRAEAARLRGELRQAIDILRGVDSIAAHRVRAQALDRLGDTAAAEREIDAIAASLMDFRAQSAADLVDGVAAFALRAEIQGRPAQDYRRMMQLLSRAQGDFDRLYWPGSLLEAKLLLDKDNASEALLALKQTFTMNPSCADGLMLRGMVAVRSFDFDTAEQIADRLDAVARRLTGDDTTRSPWSGILLARAMLRQNDPDLALELLTPTLERYPDMPEALAQRCAIEAVRYRFDSTEELLADFDRRFPGSAQALLEVGAALAESRQYAEAAQYLERASARRPNWPEPLIELGLLELQSGRDQRALDALRKVAQLDPFNRRAANSLELIEELLTYDTVESEHFVVRFKPGVDRVMAREMLAPLERNHDIVTAAIDFEPPVRTVIELMPNHRWFAVRITGMPALHTIAASTGSVIAMEAPKIGPDHKGEYDWVRVLRHEYVHTVTLARTRNRIPHWFTEAAAVNLELAPRDENAAMILAQALEHDALFDMRQINIAFVRPEKPTDRGQAYAQGHWMYQFIIDRWGERAPLDLMDLYARGMREDGAMQSVLGISQDEFFEQFKQWARQDAKGWGVISEPSIEQLRAEATMAQEGADEQAEAALRHDAMVAARAVSGLGGGAIEGIEEAPITPELIAAWLERYPDHAGLLALEVARALDASNGLATDANAPLLERYADARPVDPEPHRLLARLYLDSDSPERRARAIEHLEYLDIREQYSPAYAVELARLYAARQQWNEAADKAERATQIAPFDAGHRELAATIAIQRGDLATAERHIAALVDLEPGRSVHRKRLERIRELMASR